MKRASAWPLLVIVLVVGNVFAGLVFYDIIIKSETKVDSFDTAIQNQANRVVGLQQALDAVGPQIEALQEQIVNLNEDIQIRDEQIDILSLDLQRLETTTAQIPENFNNDNLEITPFLTLSVLSLILVIIEFITR